MEISWLGHSCFRIKGKEAVILTDPYDSTIGYALGKPKADIVTVSHNHPGHSCVAGVSGARKAINGPGEYEIADVLITGIRTFHDREGGEKRGRNTVYLIEIDEVSICHLGDLGHVPTPEQVEEMSGVGVLLVPVGGLSTIDAAEAAETVRLLDPKLVIPMHFKTEVVKIELKPVGDFLKEMGLKEVVAQPKVTVSRSSLPQDTQVVVLDYRR